MEPRARAGRHKSSLNFGKELTGFLFAYGAPTHPDLAAPQPDSAAYLATLPPTANTSHRPTPFHSPFPETLRVLDEIVTDFIIETCHEAVAHATLARRQKLTINDFKFVLRKDRMKLGRVHEMFVKAKKQEKEKKLNLMDFGAGGGAGGGGGGGGIGGIGGVGGRGGLRVEELMDLGQLVGEEGTGKGKGRGKGRRKKRKVGELEEGGPSSQQQQQQQDLDHAGGGAGAVVDDDDDDDDDDGDGQDGDDAGDADGARSQRSDRSRSKSVKRARSDMG